ncbi:MAG: RrF2 family transcriptional regulator [Streptosporangiales bacterium]
MRVSAKTDYALRALVEIGRRGGGDVPVAADDVAEAQGIPRGFLLGILGDLRRGGLLRSQRGPQGGWLLARAPEEIALADVIRIVDGPLASVHGMRPEAAEYGAGMEALQQVWIAVRSSLREVLETLTLADLLRGELPARVAARVDDEEAWRPH